MSGVLRKMPISSTVKYGNITLGDFLDGTAVMRLKAESAAISRLDAYLKKADIAACRRFLDDAL
jgi:hypothetical protein